MQKKLSPEQLAHRNMMSRISIKYLTYEHTPEEMREHFLERFLQGIEAVNVLIGLLKQNPETYEKELDQALAICNQVYDLHEEIDIDHISITAQYVEQVGYKLFRLKDQRQKLADLNISKKIEKSGENLQQLLSEKPFVVDTSSGQLIIVPLEKAM